MDLNKEFLKFFFWLLWIVRGYLILVNIWFIIVFVVFLVVWDGSGMILIYFVNWFIIIRIFVFFLGVLGRGFIKLICICFNGMFVWYWDNGYFVFFVGFLFLLYIVYVWIYVLIVLFILY